MFADTVVTVRAVPAVFLTASVHERRVNPVCLPISVLVRPVSNKKKNHSFKLGSLMGWGGKQTQLLVDEYMCNYIDDVGFASDFACLVLEQRFCWYLT